MRLGCLGLRSAAVPIFASSNEKPKEVQAEKNKKKKLLNYQKKTKRSPQLITKVKTDKI
jgi:hypothetical protein